MKYKLEMFTDFVLALTAIYVIAEAIRVLYDI